jgi:hypothetical protein
MSTSTSSNATDSQIQQALNGASAGAPPAVPGYNSGQVGSSTLSSVTGGPTVVVGRYTLSLNVDPNTKVPGSFNPQGLGQAALQLPPGAFQQEAAASQSYTVAQLLQQFSTWGQDQLAKFKADAYAAGLVSSAKPSLTETLIAYQAVVEEAASQGKPWQQLLDQATTAGWNQTATVHTLADYGLSGSGNSATSGAGGSDSSKTTETTYVSYLDPATAQGALSDAMYRLIGRTPTAQEYQAFLNSLYAYQNEENTGKFDTVNTDKTGTAGDSTSNVTQNIISQRGVGQRGLQFLAGNAAMQNPDYGPYQAATTYFHAFMQALTGPAAGEQQSGPTVTAP